MTGAEIVAICLLLAVAFVGLFVAIFGFLFRWDARRDEDHARVVRRVNAQCEREAIDRALSGPARTNRDAVVRTIAEGYAKQAMRRGGRA